MSVVLTLAITAAVAEAGAVFQRGEALFLGHDPLQGKPRGHESNLPADVVRCVNCHNAGQGSGQGSGQGALPLSRDLLLQQRQRRGGPPSVYSETSFCKMLRTGIDPVYVIIDHEMPIYALEPTECAALWTYLTEREVHDGSQ